jgi:hypothetical protein
MIAGDPLGVKQHHLFCARLYGDVLVYFLYAVGDVGEVD